MSNPQTPAAAREAITWARAELEPALFEVVRLLVSELVTNAVRHAGADSSTAVELSVSVLPEVVRIEVVDEGAGFDAPAAPVPGGEGGWGLYLVEQLADRWQVSEEGQPTRVSIELDRRRHPKDRRARSAAGQRAGR